MENIFIKVGHYFYCYLLDGK